MAKPEKINWKSNFLALKYIPRFFKLIWETNKGLFLSNAIIRIVKSILPILLLWVGKLIIDEVVLQSAAAEKDFSHIWLLLGIELGLAVLSSLLSRVINLTDGLLGDLYSNKSSVELIQKAATMQLSQLEDATFYDKLERARRQTNNRVTLMSSVLSQVQDIITVISLITGLIVFQPFLILLLLVAIIPSFLNEIKFSRYSYSLVRSWTPERRELDYLRFIGASDETAKEIKLFSLADFISERFSILATKYYLANKALAIKRAVWGSLFNIIGDLSYYGAYIIIVLRTVGGVITLGDLTFLAGSFRSLRNQLQTIFQRFTQITESALYLKDYFDFMDIDYNQKVALSNPGKIEPVKKGFTFENLSFKYPESEQYVLKNVSFHIKAEEKMALVGENGAGKTTLVKLLLRMYEPTEGRILLDGKDIWSFDADEYQKLFGVIFQDFVRYYFTARENIAVGKIEDLTNQNQIEYAAKKSLADQVIEELPHKYDQPLGKRFHDGKDLSGGQWQKVALARAYMKNAEVIVLDEPTAALDARAEFEAFERFTELSEGKTAILISHRFSTVRMADRILVLKDGGVLELGTHEELLNNKGLYAELFNYQAQGYR
jgi:ATP-binding cassette, subfamily B, bacterial